MLHLCMIKNIFQISLIYLENSLNQVILVSYKDTSVSFHTICSPYNNYRYRWLVLFDKRKTVLVGSYLKRLDFDIIMCLNTRKQKEYAN